MMGSRSDKIVQAMLTLYQDSNRDGILNQMELIGTSGSESEKQILKSLLWPIPREMDLNILSNFIQSRQISHNIFSIGCGTGLLEYLLLGSLNVIDDTPTCTSNEDYRVIGIEIDSLWWQSKYAPPLFQPVLYVGENFSNEETFGEENSLAIFSYFNNMEIFAKYLAAFQGTYVVIIGPVQKYIQHKITQFCAPNPLDLRENTLELPTREWSLVLFQRFGLTEVDYIGIYSRVE